MYSVTVHGVRPSIIPQIFGTPPSSIFRQCLIPISFSQKKIQIRASKKQ
jgi:hypothetical protein